MDEDMAKPVKKISADPYGAARMVHRLFTEQGVVHWRRYTIALILMGIAAGATALAAYILGDVINEAYVKRNLSGIVWLSVLIFVLFSARGIATYFQAVMLSRIGNMIIAHNQRQMFDKLLRENLAFFSERHSSEFLARLNTGAASVTRVLNLVITSIGRDFLSLIGLACVMVIQDPYMAIFGALIAPPAVLALRKMIRRIKSVAHTQFTSGTRILESAQETLQGIRTVKAFALEDRLRARVHASIAEVEQTSNTMARVSNRTGPLMEVLGGLAVTLALIYGGYRVVEMNATPGQFFSFMSAFLLAYEPAKRLARLNLDLSAALVGAEKLLEIIDAPASEPDDGFKPALAISRGEIEFADVSFSYGREKQVLNGMSFLARAGEVTALVGPSGGGKSTIFNLLLRFYEPSEGAIRIDGQNIGEVARASVRAQISYVGQDVFLFRGTIRENIACGKDGASDAEIIEAAKAACAHDFISAFPHGYDTPVGEHGAQLSGGQRQRVAIARALLRDARLVLLDEATAALDSESERLVQDAIAHLCQGRTTIAIAHRLHTIMHADRIHVIEQGQIVESGSHDELIANAARYARFFQLQRQAVGAADPA